jgi:superfamily II DNA or RNA helicase
MLRLRQHQKQIVETIKDKFGLWLRPRTGKTPTSIRLACSKGQSCLVLTPKHIKENWEAEIDKWNNTDCKFTLVTKERFRIDSIEKVINKGRRKTLVFSDKLPKCDVLVIDEVHRQASNYSNKFFKTVHDYILKNDVKYIYLLSGTPWNKNPWSVYSYSLLLGYKVDWNQWRNTFFIRVQYGNRSFYKPNEKMFPKLIEILGKIGVTIRLEDIIDVEEDNEQMEYFDLNQEQIKNIKDLTDTMPAVRYSRINQLEQGVLKSNGYNEGLLFPCEKDKRIEELIDDNEKLIIVCHYLDQIKKYEQLAQKKNRRFYTIRGGQRTPTTEIASSANSDENAIVIVQSDCSDGYSLKNFNVMVFASMSYSFVNWDQMTQRIKSMDKSGSCEYYYLLTRGKSVDNAIYNSIKSGKDFSDKLFEL